MPTVRTWWFKLFKLGLWMLRSLPISLENDWHVFLEGVRPLTAWSEGKCASHVRRSLAHERRKHVVHDKAYPTQLVINRTSSVKGGCCGYSCICNVTRWPIPGLRRAGWERTRRSFRLYKSIGSAHGEEKHSHSRPAGSLVNQRSLEVG